MRKQEALWRVTYLWKKCRWKKSFRPWNRFGTICAAGRGPFLRRPGMKTFWPKGTQCKSVVMMHSRIGRQPRRHAFERMFQRGIDLDAVAQVISSGEVIADYPDDQPYPSTLLLG